LLQDLHEKHIFLTFCRVAGNNALTDCARVNKDIIMSVFLSFDKHNTDVLTLRIYPDDAVTSQGLDLIGTSQVQKKFQAPWYSLTQVCLVWEEN